MNQLEKTSEETFTSNTGSGWRLRGLLHHSIGYPVVRGSSSARADLMDGCELKDRNGAADSDGDHFRRWLGMGRNRLVAP